VNSDIKVTSYLRSVTHHIDYQPKGINTPIRVARLAVGLTTMYPAFNKLYQKNQILQNLPRISKFTLRLLNKQKIYDLKKIGVKILSR
jgi:hypothetical protein